MASRRKSGPTTGAREQKGRDLFIELNPVPVPDLETVLASWSLNPVRLGISADAFASREELDQTLAKMEFDLVSKVGRSRLRQTKVRQSFYRQLLEAAAHSASVAGGAGLDAAARIAGYILQEADDTEHTKFIIRDLMPVLDAIDLALAELKEESGTGNVWFFSRANVYCRMAGLGARQSVLGQRVHASAVTAVAELITDTLSSGKQLKVFLDKFLPLAQRHDGYGCLLLEAVELAQHTESSSSEVRTKQQNRMRSVAVMGASALPAHHTLARWAINLLEGWWNKGFAHAPDHAVEQLARMRDVFLPDAEAEPSAFTLFVQDKQDRLAKVGRELPARPNNVVLFTRRAFLHVV